MASPTYSSGRGMRLEKVVGLSAGGTNGVHVNPAKPSEVAYPAGCVVVLFDAKNGKQCAYMRMAKPVASLKYSPDGKFLAVGEKGHNPAITVWDVRTHVRLAELKGHRFGVACLRFSPDSMRLISVGFEHDDRLIVWDWAESRALAEQPLGGPVLALDILPDATCIVTAGPRHVRFWEIDDADDDGKLALHEHDVGLMPDYATAVFTDVVCGTGALAGSTFLSTQCGSLICLGANRLMEKWVFLEAKTAQGLSLKNGRISCACSDGICRVFNAATFEFVMTLPRPRRHDLPLEHQEVQSAEAGGPAALASDGPDGRFAGALTAQWCLDGKSLLVVYDDRSLYVWDLHGPGDIRRRVSVLSHPVGISGISALPKTKASGVPDALFVTSAEDKRLRFWRLGNSKKKASKPAWTNAFSSEMVREVDLHLHAVKREDSADPGAVVGLKCLSVSSDGTHVAAGDKEGGVYVLDLESGAMVLDEPHAHNGAVMSMEFRGGHSAPDSGLLLATGGRDRLVHLFATERGPAAGAARRVKTLKDHSAIVTAVKFSADGGHLFSAGGDKTIVMSHVEAAADDVRVERRRSVATPQGTVNDIDVDPSNKHFCTAGTDKRIHIWSLHNGKPIRSYRPEGDAGELNKVKLDPAGMFCAIGSHDKSVRLVDFFSGECIARSAGHSEVITGLAFSNDCKRLISVSFDGCMFVWRLAPEVTSAIRERQRELSAAAKAPRPEADEENVSGQPVLPEDEALFASNRLPTWAKTKSPRTDATAPAGAAGNQEGDELLGNTEQVAEAREDGGEEPQRRAKESENDSPPSPPRQREQAKAEQRIPRAAMDDAVSVASSALTAPRSPLPNFGKIRSLAQERNSLRMQEHKQDSDQAVRRMRDQLKGLGLLAATGKPAGAATDEAEADEARAEVDDRAEVEAEELPDVDVDDLGPEPVAAVAGNNPKPPEHVAKAESVLGSKSGSRSGSGSESESENESGSESEPELRSGVAKLPVLSPKAMLSPPKPLDLPSSTPAPGVVGAGLTNGLGGLKSASYTPGAPLRTAEEARSACDFALTQMRTALASASSVFRQVEMLDDNLDQSLQRSVADDFTSKVLATSRSHVREIMGEFRTEVEQLVSQQLEPLSVRSNASAFPRGAQQTRQAQQQAPQGGGRGLERSMFLNSTPSRTEMHAMMDKLDALGALLERVVEDKIN